MSQPYTFAVSRPYRIHCTGCAYALQRSLVQIGSAGLACTLPNGMASVRSVSGWPCSGTVSLDFCSTPSSDALPTAGGAVA